VYIKYLKRNETITQKENLSNIIKSSFDDIRNILVDFEDEGIIRYRYLTRFFNPSHRDAEAFLNVIIPMVQPEFKSFDISCYIVLECDGTYDNDFLSNKGIDVLSDIIIAMKRIESLGYITLLQLSDTKYNNSKPYKEAEIVVIIKL
jgi:hypothetical protein